MADGRNGEENSLEGRYQPRRHRYRLGTKAGDSCQQNESNSDARKGPRFRQVPNPNVAKVAKIFGLHPRLRAAETLGEFRNKESDTLQSIGNLGPPNG